MSSPTDGGPKTTIGGETPNEITSMSSSISCLPMHLCHCLSSSVALSASFGLHISVMSSLFAALDLVSTPNGVKRQQSKTPQTHLFIIVSSTESSSFLFFFHQRRHLSIDVSLLIGHRDFSLRFDLSLSTNQIKSYINPPLLRGN